MNYINPANLEISSAAALTRYHLQRPQQIVLRDGTRVQVRMITEGDQDILGQFLSRVSPASFFQRFLKHRDPQSQKGVTERLLQADQQAQITVVALLEGMSTSLIIGEASMYCMPDKKGDTTSPDKAEVGLVVEDLYQGLGLGKFLLQMLMAYALTMGVSLLTLKLHHNDVKGAKFLERLSLPLEMEMDWCAGLCYANIDIQNAAAYRLLIKSGTLPAGLSSSHLQ